MERAQEYVYLDWAATAPLCEEAADAMRPYMVAGGAGMSHNANANSLHGPGRAAFEALEGARKQVARALGARRPSEIVFTSGATEADNTAVMEISEAATQARNHARAGSFTPHIVTTAIEHDAVLMPARRMEKRGYRVTYLPCDKGGFVSPAALAEAIDEDTVLVSVQMANSEVGSIQPIAELAQVAHEHGALMHTDATQALGKVDISLEELGVDAASFSGHKVGASKGIGALYVRAKTPSQAFMLGGGQEEGKRSGTQNVCGAAGFAAACTAAVENLEAEAMRQRELRDMLYERLTSYRGVVPSVCVEPGSESYLPNIASVLVEGYESETLILRLDRLGFGVSGGSACSSHSLEPSHVLKAMHVKRDLALGALRVSFGRATTREDIERFIDAFGRCIS